MEEDISLSDSELSNVDEEQYANIPTGPNEQVKIKGNGSNKCDEFGVYIMS